MFTMISLYSFHFLGHVHYAEEGSYRIVKSVDPSLLRVDKITIDGPSYHVTTPPSENSLCLCVCLFLQDPSLRTLMVSCLLSAPGSM